MVGRIERGWSVARAAEASGVSARTGYRWRARHRRGVGLPDRAARRRGPVRNMDAWHTAFRIAPGMDLYIPPDQRVRIWMG